MQISDLDANYHRIHFTYHDSDYLATFKDPSHVFLFLIVGEQIEARGAIDCTKIPGGELERMVFQMVHSNFAQGANLGLSNLKSGLADKLALAQKLNQADPTRSRELGLCVTKLEEGLMWLEKAIAYSGSSGIG